ncbi:hypothetical protein GGS23DRAFT_600991 [Durotheca rogersii]|uniref:uncharacterized protein n=1 Tax=Durotheca rogersii TaxID=419775 RepID=UPI00221FC022|nr:uncharacterized protein GGS23DRAFT_600991 [Durotheca rogersii]KAI5856726.1 hypothetical protein GGS23DRAFT_600991 [Durotheca rogersii]
MDSSPKGVSTPKAKSSADSQLPRTAVMDSSPKDVSTTKAKSADSQLSAREMEILAVTFASYEEAPKIDWQKVVDKAGFKNVSSARACFAPVKRKLLALAAQNNTGGAVDESALPETPSSNAASKRKAAGDANSSPKKKKSGRVPLPGGTPNPKPKEYKEDPVHARIKAEIREMEEKERQEAAKKEEE